MSITTKTCSRCGNEKPVEEFNRCSTHLGGDGYTNDCKSCIQIRREARKAQRGADAAEEVAEPDPEQPSLEVPHTAAVSVTWDGTDFVVTQQGTKSLQTIFIAPHALRRIWEFAEELATKQVTQTS